MISLQQPSSLRPDSLETCQKWRAAVFGLGRHAKTALNEIKTICQAELLLSSSSDECIGSRPQMDRCVQTLQQGSERLQGILAEMQQHAEALPASSDYPIKTAELSNLVSGAYYASGQWCRVRQTLEELQKRGSTDLSHLGDCQRALSRRKFVLGYGIEGAQSVASALGLDHKRRLPSSRARSHSAGAAPCPSSASTEDPAEERRRRLLESFEGALVTLLKALRGLRDTASRREKVRSAAYILRFENEYASNACSRDDSLDTLRGLLTAGPGEGPAFEPGSLHGQFLEVVLLAGREGDTDEGMSDEVMEALSKDIEDFLLKHAEVCSEALRLKDGKKAAQAQRRRLSKAESARHSTPTLPAAAPMRETITPGSRNARNRGSAGGPQMARPLAPTWDANELLLVNGEAQAFRASSSGHAPPHQHAQSSLSLSSNAGSMQPTPPHSGSSANGLRYGVSGGGDMEWRGEEGGMSVGGLAAGALGRPLQRTIRRGGRR